MTTLTNVESRAIDAASCPSHRPGGETFTCRRCSAAQDAVIAQVIERRLDAAKAQALRDAADALGKQPKKPVLRERESCDWWDEEPVADWLRARAATLDLPAGGTGPASPNLPDTGPESIDPPAGTST